MEIIAYLINNLFLVLYTILGGIDFGVGTLILIFLLFKKDTKFIFKIFNPLWEVNHVLLIFFLITSFGFFPKAVEVYSNLLIIPLMLAVLFFFIRTASYIYLSFYNEDSKKYKLSFGISSILSVIFLNSFILINLRIFSNSLSVIRPTWLGIIFSIFIIINVIILASAFIRNFTTKFSSESETNFLNNINYIAVISWIIMIGLLNYFILFQTNYIDENRIMSYVLVSIFLVLAIFLSNLLNKRYFFSFIIQVICILVPLISLLVMKFPFLSLSNRTTVYQAFTSVENFQSSILVMGIGAIIAIPCLILFYVIFLKTFLTHE